VASTPFPELHLVVFYLYFAHMSKFKKGKTSDLAKSADKKVIKGLKLRYKIARIIASLLIKYT